MTRPYPTLWALVMWNRDGGFDAVLDVGYAPEIQARVDAWPTDSAFSVSCELVQESARNGSSRPVCICNQGEHSAHERGCPAGFTQRDDPAHLASVTPPGKPTYLTEDR